LTATHLLSNCGRSATHDRWNRAHERTSGWAAHESTGNSTDAAHQLRGSTHYCGRCSGNHACSDRDQRSDEGFRLFLSFSFRSSVAEVFHERFVVDPSLRIYLEFAFGLAFEF